MHSFQRNASSAFFCKRTLCSLRSFAFFAKECCILCVLLGLISRQKLEKRTEKNVAFFKRTGKNGMFSTEQNAVPSPDWKLQNKTDFKNCGLEDSYERWLIFAKSMTTYLVVFSPVQGGTTALLLGLLLHLLPADHPARLALPHSRKHSQHHR